MYIVTVEFVVGAQHVEAFQQAVQQQAHNSLTLEADCHQFDVCTDPQDRRRTFLYEVYTDEAAFHAHRETEHFANFGENWDMVADWDALVFIDNHDTQWVDDRVLTHKNSTEYKMAVTFMLAWPYGYARVMSSYFFTNRDQGPPSVENCYDVSAVAFKCAFYTLFIVSKSFV